MNTAAQAKLESPMARIRFQEHPRDFERQQPAIRSQAETDPMTREGLLMTEALAAAHNAPDIRSERVQAIAAGIANGTYVIDPLRIAEALIRENPGLFKSYR